LKLAATLVCLAILGAPSPAPKPPAVSAPPTELRIGIASPGGGYTITTMPLEAYVARVVAGEAARDSGPAALEALAITVRTFALANRDRHRADGFDLCDQTHCQVVRTATAATSKAAERTVGRVLLHDGVPASIYYGASCGGRTEIPSAVWPGAQDPPYLPSQRDDACGGAPAWTADLDETDLFRALHAAGFRGDRLRDVRIAAHDASGRVARLRLDGLTPGEISGQDLRVAVGRTLGWLHIKSTAFDLQRLPSGYRFTGHGSGHGVGLCVIGSAHLAVEGQTADQILERYFPGLAIAPFAPATIARPSTSARPAPSGVLVSLPDEDEGERAAIDEETRRARDEVAQALGLPVPGRITLRFHPTTDSFERATGQPWFASGAVLNGELHFTPLAVLRARGVLARVIRRELVMAMAAPVLARRPLWVREGVAAYFSDSADQAPPSSRVSCPSDPELAHPVSAGALSNASARARACVARQIAAGRDWRDVR
jgi:SpoIID/LytB domain protein